MLKNFKIGTKLLAGFIFLTLLTVITGVVGWYYLEEVAKESSKLEQLLTIGNIGDEISKAADDAVLNGISYSWIPNKAT
ncbi:MAG: MCP four helix bundle domain-containing protein, partial [Thermoguttaceae bacterium]